MDAKFMFFGIPTIIFFAILIIGILISVPKTNKKMNHEYIITDSYLLEQGTAIYFKSFRHLKVYIGKYKNYKAINLYLMPDGRTLETVANGLIDKELTALDKDVFVLKIEDFEENTKLISYDINKLSNSYQNYLKSLQVGDKVSLKEITDNLTDSHSGYSTILIK